MLNNHIQIFLLITQHEFLIINLILLNQLNQPFSIILYIFLLFLEIDELIIDYHYILIYL